ncbi:MAG TPA: heavy-metal-associated domain-containing protein [Ktedonobacteraceae bacterium]|jgi:copper ion binding protein
METLNLVAPDISCEHCQHAIEGSLRKVAGVNVVNVNIPAKTVHVEFDPQRVNQMQIEETLDDIGYAVAH